MSAAKVKKPRKEAEPRWQTHVYLSEADYAALKSTADRESRSLTMQIQHFIRQRNRKGQAMIEPTDRPDGDGLSPFAWFKTTAQGKPSEFVHGAFDAKVLEETGFILTPVYRIADVVATLRQHARDIRSANSGGDGSEPGWHAADVLDHIANNWNEIVARQPSSTRDGAEGAVCAACGAARREHTTPGGIRYGEQSLCGIFIPSAPPQPAPDAMRSALQELTGAMRFVLAFYEPGQRYLDTNAWKNAEASARDAFEKAEAALSAPVLSPDGALIEQCALIADAELIRPASGMQWAWNNACKAIAEKIRALSPSGAVAAEPDWAET
jgi:hypothetical protein